MVWDYIYSHLPGQIRAIIANREKNSKNTYQPSSFIIPKTPKNFNKHIFYRIPYRNDGVLNALAVMKSFELFAKKNNELWISIDLPHRKISEKQKRVFDKALANHNKVFIYFGVRNKSLAKEDNLYKGQLIKIVTSEIKGKTPDSKITPEIIINDESCTWLKITNLYEETCNSINDFQVFSTNHNLKDHINKNNFSFGYIKLID